MTHQNITLPIFNLSCSGGGALVVEHALARTSGVTHVYVNPVTEMAYIHYDPILTTPTQLAAVIAESGFGPSDRQAQPAVAAPARSTDRLYTQRLALTAGLWLAVIYALCVALGLLFPNLFQMYRLWEVLLPGVLWARPLTLLLGLGETFIYGLFGGWLFVVIQQQLTRSLSRNAR